jgi:hypothetical protein
MNKLISALVSVALLGGISLADDVKRSSHTATNDSIRRITGALAGSTLVSVVVSSPTATGTITLYDSNATATNLIGVVHCGTLQSPVYDVRVSSGISYVSDDCTGGVTVIWK